MTTLGLEHRTDRCSHGFALVHHPAFCDCADMGEWSIFLAALRAAAEQSPDHRVHQHLVRPLIRGRVFHKNVGLFYRRAKSEGLIEPVGEEQSKDTAGRNTHHKSPVYELRSAA